MPVVGNGGVISFLYSYPSLYFWTTKLVVSSCSTSVAGYWGRLYRWWWKSTTATTGRYVSVMVLCYRQRIILRPTSKQYTANALMSCVGLGRSPLVTFHMTSSRAPTYLAWQTTRLSKDQVSSTRVHMIGICMQHNMFLIMMHGISSCCSAWFFLSWFPQDSAAMLAHLSHDDAALYVLFCSGSSKSLFFLVNVGFVEMCLSQSEWCKAPSSCISMS
jgi:hypothetical protein